MDTTAQADAHQSDSLAPHLKSCPFCAGHAEVITAYEPTKYGVRCVACRAYFLPNLESVELAVAAWNRRNGTGAAAGGRATKGISTPKKRRSSTRNLKAARQAKKLIRLRSATERVVAQLRPTRQAELEELTRESRSRLAKLLPRLIANPVLTGTVVSAEPTLSGDALGHH